MPPAPAGARWLYLVSLAGLLVVAPAAQAAATGDTARLAAEALRFGSGYEARQKAITPPPEDSPASANPTPTDTLPAPTGHASGQRTGAGSAQGNGRGNGGGQGGQCGAQLGAAEAGVAFGIHHQGRAAVAAVRATAAGAQSQGGQHRCRQRAQAANRVPWPTAGTVRGL